MSGPLPNQRDEYRASVSGAVLVSVALHVLMVTMGGFLLIARPNIMEQTSLGYRGPKKVLREIDILEPNSVQAFFHQRRREGRRRSPEYRVVERFKPDPGPNPLAVRQRVKEPDPHPTTVSEDFELVDPVLPSHRDVAFSQDFTILHAIEPDYPEYELAREVEGYVLITCYVTAEGEILEEQVLESHTLPDGGSPRAFELAALEAVKKWRVLPPVHDGKPRGAWLKIPFDFDLTHVTH